MARLHSKRGPMHEINVVPYVDVMLVLLVIFMVTAPLVTPGVVELPSVSKAPVAPVARSGLRDIDRGNLHDPVVLARRKPRRLEVNDGVSAHAEAPDQSDCRHAIEGRFRPQENR